MLCKRIEVDYNTMSSSGSGINEGNDVAETQGFSLPGYLAYLSLGFKMIMMVLILFMVGCIFATIKSTRKLHKPHNIFVAKLMVGDILAALLTTLPCVVMMIGFVADFISCNVKQFLLFPIIAIHFTYLMIAIDKVIAIAFPFKHKGIMTPYVVSSMVATSWLLALLLSVKTLFNTDGYVKNAEYGLCTSIGSAFIEILLTHILPMFIISLLAMVFNVYLAIKAYQIYRQIQKEIRRSGVTSEVVALREKQHKIKKHLKPIVTLLVVMFGGSFIAFLFLLLLIPVRLLWHHENVIGYLIAPNVIYIVFLLHPIVYGLYFKQVRESMVKTLKRMLCKNKLNNVVVAPQP